MSISFCIDGDYLEKISFSQVISTVETAVA